MRVRKLVIAAAVIGFSPLASADPCAGVPPFGDVPAGELFCTNTEWLANRSITLGCTTTTFCPELPVTRAQMSLFMNRLGTALTPVINETEGSGGAVELDAEVFHCVSPAYTIEDYPRTMVLHGSFSGLTAGAASYAINIRYNTDGNPTTFPNFINSYFEKTGSPGATWTHVSTSAVLPLEVGTTYRFAIRTVRDSGTADLAAMNCRLTQQILNRNGTAAPFDAAARSGPSDE